jgi:hypothetical protein
MEWAALLWASRGQRWGLNEGRCVVWTMDCSVPGPILVDLNLEP